MHTPEEPARKNAGVLLDKIRHRLPHCLSINFSAGHGTALCRERPIYPLFFGVISLFALWQIGCRGIEPSSPSASGNDTPPIKDGATAARPLKIQLGSSEIKLQGGEAPLQIKLDSTPIKVQGAVELKTHLADVLKGDAIPLKISGLDKPISIRLEGWPTKESPAEVHMSGARGIPSENEVNKAVEDLRLQLQQSEQRLRDEIRLTWRDKLPGENTNGATVEKKLESIDQHLAALAGLFQSAITLWKKGNVTGTVGTSLPAEKLEEIKSRLDDVKAQLGPDSFLNPRIQDLTRRIRELERGGRVETTLETRPMKIEWLSVGFILAIIFAAGVLGGLISAFAIPGERQLHRGLEAILVRILEAVAAAAFVPGLLFAIHSDLLEKAETYSYPVALFSLCLIAATIGAPFIQFVHNKAAIWMRRELGLPEWGISSRPSTAILSRVASLLDSLPGAPASRDPLRRLKAWVEFLTTHVPHDRAVSALEDLEKFVTESVKESSDAGALKEIEKRLVAFENESPGPGGKIMPSLIEAVKEHVIPRAN